MNATLALADVDDAAPARAAAPLFRAGTAADAGAILRLIDDSLDEGHLLPRTLEDLAAHAHRFVVLAGENAILACAELAPLSRAVAEVRSLVVDRHHRGRGIATQLISRLGREARRAGFSTLCALTHEPSHFVRLGFSIVPHVWFPEKIAVDCTACPKFRACGQHAVALPLTRGSLAASGVNRLPLAWAPRPVAMTLRTPREDGTR